MVKLLFDTNILLDLCNANRAPFHQDSLDLLGRCVRRGDVEMMVCVASLNDVYYVLRRHYGSERQARQYVGKLMELFDVRPLLPRHARRSLASDEPDFEDGLIRAVAEDAGVDATVPATARRLRVRPFPAKPRGSVWRRCCSVAVDVPCGYTG